MTAGFVYVMVLAVSALLAFYLISRSLKARSTVGGNRVEGERDYKMPAGGIQLGRRFTPETGYLDSVETDEGLNPNPITTSDTLKETLEAQDKNPRT
ncbi:hypothetical protein [Effusibacillus consociatus]|uniref:Uncharacterized protein n=1 Tax=Effusibacillus consociatus TaxID=1117041 RepID=A0ABV9Q2Y6_9BACL